jgi:hypothetical protein
MAKFIYKITVVTLEYHGSNLIGSAPESVLKKPPEKGAACIMRPSTDGHKRSELKGGHGGQRGGVFSERKKPTSQLLLPPPGGGEKKKAYTR